MNRKWIKYLFGILVIAIMASLASGLFRLKDRYEDDRRNTATRIALLENQIASLSNALAASNALSEATKRQLQELSARPAAVKPSQDDLLVSTVAKAAPSVVSIVISKDVALLEVGYANPFGDDPSFRDFGVRVPTYRQVGTEKRQVGAGTGFFIRSDGYILTNRHVVSDEKAEYTVLLASGQQKPARVVYRDTSRDVAILKIESTGHVPLNLGDSSSLSLGQTVVAIGNALGEYNNSVSVGIISGLNRTIEASDSEGNLEKLEGVIQTDAAINRGNSGGPLLDLSGKVVGLNVAMQGGASNIAFAIPIDDAKSIINRAI